MVKDVLVLSSTSVCTLSESSIISELTLSSPAPRYLNRGICSSPMWAIWYCHIPSRSFSSSCGLLSINIPLASASLKGFISTLLLSHLYSRRIMWSPTSRTLYSPLATMTNTAGAFTVVPGSPISLTPSTLSQSTGCGFLATNRILPLFPSSLFKSSGSDGLVVVGVTTVNPSKWSSVICLTSACSEFSRYAYLSSNLSLSLSSPLILCPL